MDQLPAIQRNVFACNHFHQSAWDGYEQGATATYRTDFIEQSAIDYISLGLNKAADIKSLARHL